MRSRKKRLWSWILQTAILTVLLSTVLALPEVIKIGGVFEIMEEQQQQAFRYAIDSINTNSGILPRSRLSARITKVAPQDSFRALKTACDFFEEGIAGLFGPPSPSTAGTLQSACDNLQVPYFQTHWDYKSTSRMHTISLFPDTRTLATAFLDVITHWKWTSFTIIYEDNEALMRLQEIVKIPTALDIRVKVRHVEPDQDYKKLIKDLKNSREFNFVVDLPLYSVQKLFADALELEWMTTYQTYFLTSLDIHTVQWNADVVKQPNITALRIVDPENPDVSRVVKDWIFSEKRQGRRISSKQPLLTETALIYDGIDILARSLEELDSSQNIDIKSLYCQDTFYWAHGKSITNYIKLKHRHGLSGDIKFDENGLRTFFTADIVKLTSKGIPKKIGTWDPQNKAKFSQSDSRLGKEIDEIIGNTTLRVATIISEPYVMLREPPEGETLEGNDRYEGFCVDVIRELATMKKFKFVIDVSETPTYGDNKTGEWNGMVGKLIRREADFAIVDLTITHMRESVVDFTHPFMNLGISILFKKPVKTPPTLFSFTQPLSLEVWFYMATAFLGVSLFLFITARLTPYEWVNPHPCETENDTVENQFTLLNSFWFVMGSIMQQGSDILPRAVSTRIIASSWWFFTMIMISSYTANLAAFLTAQRMTSPIESAQDLAKQTKIVYGCVGGGSTQNFFKNSEYPIYKRMWSFMESHRPTVFTKDNLEGIERVKAGNYAFLMESTSIEYNVERQCELTMIGGELDSKGYGIALPKQSVFLGVLNSGVLAMQGSGRFHILKDRWWKKSGGAGCEHEKPPSAEMGIRNVAGVFLVVAVGIVAGVIVVLFEYIWKAKNQMDRDPIILMLWRDLRDILRGRGSSRPAPKETEEESVEKLPMVNLRTNPNTESELFS